MTEVQENVKKKKMFSLPKKKNNPDSDQQSAKEKKKKEARVYRDPIDSTQLNIPVKDIYRGIIVTKDGRYIKLLEFSPVTFTLMSATQQNMIIRDFATALSVGPKNIQISCMTMPADLKNLIANVEKNLEKESDVSALQIGREYLETLHNVEANSITRRYFVSFEYHRDTRNILRQSSFDDIVVQLNNQASLFISSMRVCGNFLVRNPEISETEQIAQIFYAIYNRTKVIDEPFTDHYMTIYNRYYEEYVKQGLDLNDGDIYIPASEYIAPDVINIRDSKFIQVNDMYYSFLYMSGANHTDFVPGGWIGDFLQANENIDVNIYFERLDEREIMSRLRKNLIYNELSLDSASNATQSFEVTSKKFEATNYLRNGVANNDSFFYIGVLFSVFGKDPKEVDDSVNDLMNFGLRMNNTKLKELKFEEEEAFISSLPLARINSSIWKKAKINVLSSGAASVYPFTSREMHDDNGIYLGDDEDSQSPAIINFFDGNKFNNANIFVCGTSGKGKTYSLSLIAERMRLMQIPVYIIIPEKEAEFQRLCTALSGQFVQLGAGSKHIMNPLDIIPPNESISAELDGGLADISLRAKKLDSLLIFFKMVIDKTDAEEEQLLLSAIEKTYLKFGITNDNNSIWEINAKGEKVVKKMPTVSDVQRSLKEMEKTEPKCKRMATILNRLTSSCFNGQTNVNLKNDFIVFGLQNMNKNDIPLGIQTALDFVWTQIQNDRAKRKAVFVDEFWKFAFNPNAAEYFTQMAKTIRGYGGLMLLATQQMNDVFMNKDLCLPILNNCDTKIILGLTEMEAKLVAEVMDITEEDQRKITEFERGHAFMMSGKNSMKIHFRATPNEHLLISTDAKDIERYYILRKQQELQEENRKKMFNQTKTNDYVLGQIAKVFDEYNAKASDDKSSSDIIDLDQIDLDFEIDSIDDVDFVLDEDIED